MNATSHLELLREMFPEKFVLDIVEIAKVLGCSKQWLYVQSSRKALPFTKLPGSRIRVTVVELAHYLDTSGSLAMCEEITRGMSKPDAEAQARDLLPVKRKPGRPRKIDRVLKK